MNKIYDIILTPNIVNAIKKVGENKGVQLINLIWQAQTFENKDISETCFTFSEFRDGIEVEFEQPEIKPIENKK